MPKKHGKIKKLLKVLSKANPYEGAKAMGKDAKGVTSKLYSAWKNRKKKPKKPRSFNEDLYRENLRSISKKQGLTPQETEKRVKAINYSKK